MGTNYFVKLNICKLCRRTDDPIHLGKASYGWSFMLQANNYKFYRNWEEMKEWLKGKNIEDEYGEHISRKEFIKWVEDVKDIKDPEKVDYGTDLKIIDGYKFYDCDFS